MQLYNFAEAPQSLDTLQAWGMPNDQLNNIGENLEELSAEPTEITNLMADFDKMTPEMQELFFKKVGKWFKKTTKYVAKGLSIAQQVSSTAMPFLPP
jgi:hypothetical protein